MNVLNFMLNHNKDGWYKIRCGGREITESGEVNPYKIMRCEEQRHEILKVLPYQVKYFRASDMLIGCEPMRVAEEGTPLAS